MAPTIKVRVAEPKVVKRSVKGATLKDVRIALDKLDEYGLYDATQGMEQKGDQRDGAVTQLTVTLHPTITLPEWSDYASATKEEQGKWDEVYAALEAHEQAHHEIQVKAAKDLEKALKKVKGLTVEDAQELVEKAQATCEKAQVALDSSTGHGKKSGAYLEA